ncbi:MAG: hypothetical protein B6I28_01290 [Fusobacteriia bacterium 4572_132]|nr:MAG: hypothetical protein B6I28_01290 [Fusobacteriia bacterium 4572_132]
MQDFTKFKNWLLLNKPSKSTVNNYLYKVKAFFKKYNNFNQENINNYLLARIEKEYSKATFNLDINSLKSYAEFKDIKIKFPKIRKEDRKIKNFINENELFELIAKIPFMIRDAEKYQALVTLLFYTGLRIGEVFRLKREDIDLDKRTVTVRISKSKKSRVCVLSKKALPYLNIYFLREREINNAFNISISSAQSIIRKLGKMMGWKKFHPHVFRHSASMYWLKKTKYNLLAVQKLLGHASVETTTLYTELSNEEVVNLVKKIR